MTELLVGTKKGLVVLRGGARRDLRGRPRAPSRARWWSSPRAIPRSGRYFASVTHGQFGPHLFYSRRSRRASGSRPRGPAFPASANAAVERIWVDRARRRRRRGVVRRRAGGAVPQRRRRQDLGAGAGAVGRARAAALGTRRRRAVPPLDLPLARRSEAPGGRHLVGGRLAHRRRRQELAARRQRAWCRATCRRRRARTRTPIASTTCERAPRQPATLYMQFHGGVYRSDDAGESWIDIGTDRGLPSDFGFPLAIDSARSRPRVRHPADGGYGPRDPRGPRARVRDARPGRQLATARRRASRSPRPISPCCGRPSAPTALVRSASTSAPSRAGSMDRQTAAAHLVHVGGPNPPACFYRYAAPWA